MEKFTKLDAVAAQGGLDLHVDERGGRAAGIGGRDCDGERVVVPRDIADDAEIGERNRRDLWVGDLVQPGPDLFGAWPLHGGYHVLPG